MCGCIWPTALLWACRWQRPPAGSWPTGRQIGRWGGQASRPGHPLPQSGGHVRVHQSTSEVKYRPDVDLVGARFGHTQDATDLLEGQLVLVVESQNHPRALAQALDRLHQRRGGVPPGSFFGRVDGAGIRRDVGQPTPLVLAVATTVFVE